MKLLDFFNKYEHCRACNNSHLSTCCVLYKYPEEARLALAQGFVELREYPPHSGSSFSLCEIVLTERGKEFSNQLQGDFS